MGVGSFLSSLFGEDEDELKERGLRMPGMPLPGVNMPAGAIDESGAMGREPMSQDDVTVMGDSWKPRKPTVLGRIADALLEISGDEPIFAKEREQQNLQSAMEGFVSNPEQAIRRMAKIPGMQKQAWDMYDKYMDNKRADMASGTLADTRQEKFLTRIGGMLNSISRAKDPAAAYAANLPMIQRYAQSRGVDITGLPSTYDPDAIGHFISGSVSPEDQMRMEALEQYRAQRLGLDTRKADDMAAYRSERLEDFDTQEAGRNARAAEAEAARNQRAADAEAGRDRRSNKPSASGQRLVDTPQGPAILKPDGTLIVKKGNKLIGYVKRKSANGVTQYVKWQEKEIKE